jgi:hypothetical protein
VIESRLGHRLFAYWLLDQIMLVIHGGVQLRGLILERRAPCLVALAPVLVVLEPLRTILLAGSQTAVSAGLVLGIGVGLFCGSRPAANRTERLAFSTFDLGGVGATAALEIEVLANRVVE